MGSDYCLAGIKDNLMVLPCHGQGDTWLLGKPFGVLGTPLLFGRNNQLVGLDLPEDILEEAGMLNPEAHGTFVAEGCTLGTWCRAEDKVTPGCMQGVVDPKVPGIDSVAAEELGQGAECNLYTGCWIFRQGIESWLVCGG